MLRYNEIAMETNKITLSRLMITLRPYTNDPSEAYQLLLGDFLGCLSGNAAYFVESTSSSRIMNGIYDVPKEIRKVVNQEEGKAFDKNVSKFANECLDPVKLDGMAKALKEMAASSSMSSDVKKAIEDEKNALAILSVLSLAAVRADNRRALNEEIWSSGPSKIKHNKLKS